MDILDLETSLKFVNYNGVGLNLQERFQLENAIQDLLNSADKHDFEELMFWGRVEGVKQDYYLCLGVTYTDKYEFPEKRFYWASSADFKFKQFPAINDQHLETFDNIQGMFTGEPNHVIFAVKKDDAPAEEAAEAQPPATEEPKEKDPLASTEEEDPNAKIELRAFTELDRLQWTIYAIENDCHIMPKGSIKLTDQHEVRRDNAFRGLSINDACQLENYVHFRKVQDHLKAANLEKDECVFRKDFLDEACNQKVKGAVSAQKVSTKGNVALLRNHMWPGFATYHIAGTKTHGCFYFGEGQKNLDLSF